VDDQPEPAAPRQRWRWSGWRAGTVVVGLVCGGLFVVSAQSSQGTDLRPGRYDEDRRPTFEPNSLLDDRRVG